METPRLDDGANALVDRIAESLLRQPALPTAIMAGHNVVAPDGTYSDVFGDFPDVSRNIGKAIIERTRDSLSSIKLFALINDWYALRNESPERQHTVRKQYWRDPAMAFDVESDPLWQPYLLEGRGVRKSDRPQGRFSEYALQQAFRSVYGERSIGRLSKECNQCSSEIVMMTSMLYRRGVRRLVSFIPNVCMRAVDIGSDLLARGEFQADTHRFEEPFEMTNVYLNAYDKMWSPEDVCANTTSPVTHIIQ